MNFVIADEFPSLTITTNLILQKLYAITYMFQCIHVFHWSCIENGPGGLPPPMANLAKNLDLKIYLKTKYFSILNTQVLLTINTFY